MSTKLVFCILLFLLIAIGSVHASNDAFLSIGNQDTDQLIISGNYQVDESAFDHSQLEVEGNFEAINPSDIDAVNVQAFVIFEYKNEEILSDTVYLGTIPAGDRVRKSEKILLKFPVTNLRTIQDSIMNGNSLQLLINGYSIDGTDHYYPTVTQKPITDNLYKSATYKLKFKYPESLIVKEDICREWLYKDDGKSVTTDVNCIKIGDDNKNWRLYILKSERYNFLNDITFDSWLDISKMTQKTLTDGTIIIDNIKDAQNDAIKYFKRPDVSYKVKFDKGYNVTDEPFQEVYDSIELI